MWLNTKAEVTLRLRVSEYRIPRRVTAGWGILENKELHDFRSSPIIIKKLK
jgi:hypothetical protein